MKEHFSAYSTDKDITRKKLEANNSHKILVNEIQQYFKRVIPYGQVGLSSECRAGLTHSKTNHHTKRIKKESQMIIWIDRKKEN